LNRISLVQFLEELVELLFEFLSHTNKGELSLAFLLRRSFKQFGLGKEKEDKELDSKLKEGRIER